MGIGGLVGLVVSEADVFAEAAEALPLHHDAVSGRQDRRPARRGKVQALVHSGVTEDRMVALAEERRQAASVDGGFHQAGLDAAAGRIEEPGVAVAGRIAVDAEGAFAQREGGVNEAAGVLGAKAAIVEYLVPKGEAVTGLDVTLDVHRVAEDAVGIHQDRSDEHTSELQSLMRISYAVFCLQKTKPNTH